MKKFVGFIFLLFLFGSTAQAQLILQQGTSVVISFGPFVDKTDGVTLETGLVSALDHATTGIKLSKAGGALTVRHATVTATTYDSYGNYLVTLDSTDTNTIGILRMQFVEEATCRPVSMDFMVVGEPAYTKNITGSVVSLQDLFDFSAANAGATTGSWGNQLITNLWAPVFSANAIDDPVGVPEWPLTPPQIMAYWARQNFNKTTVTNTTKTFYNSSDTAQSKQTLSDDGTTFTQGKQEAPD